MEFRGRPKPRYRFNCGLAGGVETASANLFGSYVVSRRRDWTRGHFRAILRQKGIHSMKKLYMARESSEAEMLKGLMEQQGIECTIRNETVRDTVGPLVFCYPELWILSDEDYAAANQILADWRAAPSGERKDWTCPECGEEISGQFDSCWRCAGHEPAVAEGHADNEEA